MENQNGYNAVVENSDPRYQELASFIDAGREQAGHLFHNLERNIPRDFLVNTGDLGFSIRDNGRVCVRTKENEFLLHQHAVSQMVGKTGILTGRVADKMGSAANKEGSWGRDLLLHNLRTIFRESERDRVLIRAVNTDQGPEVRGFLSDRYRRMNSGPIFQAFAEAAQQYDAVPVYIPGKNRYGTSFVHDVRVGFSMFLPHIFRPIDSMRDELLIIGLTIMNSDFGAGALSVSFQVMRIWCRNLMVTKDELRKVHLGARLTGDIQFGEDTYNSDTTTMALAIRDIVKGLLGPVNVGVLMKRIKKTAETEIDADGTLENLRKGGHLLKGEAEDIKKIYNSAEVELLPPGNTAWRASNAISLFANQIEAGGNAERALDMREAAGVILDEKLKLLPKEAA